MDYGGSKFQNWKKTLTDKTIAEETELWLKFLENLFINHFLP